MAKKSNDEDQVDKLSQQIIDKKIQILEISKEIKDIRSPNSVFIRAS